MNTKRKTIQSENEVLIKNRMLQKALEYWNVSAVVSAKDLENSFDPIVSMLIGACASEIAKISNEFDHVTERIEKLLFKMMMPESIHGTKPAHAITLVEPLSSNAVVKPEHLLYHKRENGDIFFSPLQQFNIVDIKITKLFNSYGLFNLNFKAASENLLSQTLDKSEFKSSTIFIGLSVNKPIDLNHIPIYFELTDMVDNELFYYHLSTAKFYLNDKLIETKPGLHCSEGKNTKQINLKLLLESYANKTYNIEQEINDYYKKHFISISNSELLPKENLTEETIPEEIKNTIHKDDEKLFVGYNWIKIEFSSIVSDKMLENIYCTFNAIPVLNRKLEKKNHQLQKYINIISVGTKNLFLDINTISNEENKIYTQQASTSKEKGTFIIRKDNVGKFDNQDATEQIVKLLQLLKEESAAFGALRDATLVSKISDLNTSIRQLELELEENKKDNIDKRFVIVEPYEEDENIFIEFWSTNASEANQIKIDSILHWYNNTKVGQSARLLTSATGGMDGLNSNQEANAYRMALISRDRIVTKEDIKALCFLLCDDKVEQVEVQKNYLIGNGTAEGFERCIEIILYANKKINILPNEWIDIKKSILFNLEQKSLNIYPYNIKII